MAHSGCSLERAGEPDRLIELDDRSASATSVPVARPQVSETRRAGDAALPWPMVAFITFYNVIIGVNESAFALFYVQFTEYFGLSKGLGAVIGALQPATSMITGLFFSYPVERLGCRALAVSGGFVSFVGFAASAFSPNAVVLCILYGFVCGVGLSMGYMATSVIGQYYFTRRRTLLTSITYTGYGVGQVVSPWLLTFFIEEYGWRGAMLLHAAIMAHLMVSGATFRPPEGYDKRNAQQRDATPAPNHKDDQLNDTTGRIIFRHIKRTLDFSMGRNSCFVLFLCGVFASKLMVDGFLQSIASLTAHHGFSASQTALLMSLMNWLLFLRPLFGYISDLSCVNRRMVFLVGTLVGVASCVIVTMASSFASLIAAAVLFGLNQGLCNTIDTVCLVDLLGAESISRSQGLFNLVAGTASLISTPVYGWCFDVTRDYDASYYIGAACGTCGALFVLCCFINERRKKRTARNNTAAVVDL